jgi:large subunit ribosomal protein L28
MSATPSIPSQTDKARCALQAWRNRTRRSGDRTVAAHCDICGKSPSFGHSISHSHRRTKRRWNPNIQRVRTVVAGTPKRMNVCTSCLKAGKAQRTA